MKTTIKEIRAMRDDLSEAADEVEQSKFRDLLLDTASALNELAGALVYKAQQEKEVQ